MRVKQDRVQGPTAQWLLEIIEDFLTLNELDNDGCLFGWVLSKDRTLVQRLRDGGDVTTSKMDEILVFVQNPVSFAQTGVRKGRVRNIPLKPITIKPKELP